MAVSNNLTAILNFLALMCSIPIIAAGIWIASNPDNQCIHWIRWPLVFLGVALLTVSLTGFVGAYWKKEGLLAVYLVSMFILIILLLVLLVLAFVVTRPDGGYAVPGTGFREYRVDGFSSWLRNHITGNCWEFTDLPPATSSPPVVFSVTLAGSDCPVRFPRFQDSKLGHDSASGSHTPATSSWVTSAVAPVAHTNQTPNPKLSALSRLTLSNWTPSIGTHQLNHTKQYTTHPFYIPGNCTL